MTALLLIPLMTVTRTFQCLTSVRMAATLAAVCVAVVVDLGLTNLGLTLLPLPLQQGIAATVPLATVLLETIVRRRRKPCLV